MMNEKYLKIYKVFCEKHADEPHYLASVKSFIEAINDSDFKINLINDFIYPNHIVAFDVEWKDDAGKLITNKGYRVQHDNTLGVYKGGIRFAPSVNLDILKALAFEQTLKNSLTGLPLGGAKGGSDFNPKGKSNDEMTAFINAFMQKLSPHLGSNIDVPAGDLGVSQIEVTAMQKAYEETLNTKDITFTSKLISAGGSLLRPEATGYGLIFIVLEALKKRLSTTLEGKRVVISGSGNVASHAAYKAQSLGALVVTMSGTTGAIYDQKGIDVDLIVKLKNNKEPLSEYLKIHKDAKYYPDPTSIWNVECDIALPCATQDEIDLESAKKLVKTGTKLIAEGSNLALTSEAVNYLVENEVLFLPGKAANAGGVAVSYFEMVQNEANVVWSADQVGDELEKVMSNIFKRINEYAFKNNIPFDLRKAADLVSFITIADARKKSE